MLRMLSYHETGPTKEWGWRLGEPFPYDGVFPNRAHVRIIVDGPELEFVKNQFSNLPCPKGNNAYFTGELARFIGSNMFFAVEEARTTAADVPIELAQAQLAKVREAIQLYYRALDMRQHGDVAQDRAFKSIEDALGMRWTQGATLRGE